MASGSRQQEADAVGPQAATAPAQARGPLRAPPGPTSLGDSVSDKRRKPPQVQVTDSRANTCQGPRWPGAGLVGECSNLSRVPNKGLRVRPPRVKVPVPALPQSKSPSPPFPGQNSYPQATLT
ncbi:unnamed protein product [Rangifer tarandus platyrhynchus]|uniref:Uncharacterized protein n=1 Tax=Rangifer tarandus platyrhynchus TaxID=3082113 RepID=A0ABN8ZNQ5_RANTA|nr:unnamed protein product [Rangifer tarandus platyrhynchus]